MTRTSTGAGSTSPSQRAAGRSPGPRPAWRHAAVRLTLALALAGCSAAPTPSQLDAPAGPPGPALLVAPLERSDVATADRPVFTAGEPVRPFERVRCNGCQEELTSPDRGARPACEECRGTTFQEAFSPPFRPRLQPDVAGRVAAALGRRATFERAEALPADALAPGLQGVARVDACLAAARARGARWLLLPRVERCAVEYETNGAIGVEIGVFIVCAVLLVPGLDPPNWFIASEDYFIQTNGSARVVDVATGRDVADLPFTVETRGSFAELGPPPTREFHIVGFLRAPGCLDEEEWDEVAAQLRRCADGDLVNALVRAVESARPGAPKPPPPRAE